LLRTLRAILGPALLAVLHTLGVEDTAQDVIANTGKVANAAAADQHHGVFLQIVPLAGDVGNHFTLVGQTNLGHLTESGVRLLGGRGVNTGAYAALLRVSFHGRNLVPLWLAGAWLADQLINGGHCALSIGPKLYGQHKQTKVALTRPLSGSEI